MPRKYALIICLLLITGSTILVFNNIAVWMSRNDVPAPADLIICLSGEYRIAKAAQLYRQGLSNTVLLTVRETDDALVQKGVPSGAVHLAPGVRTTFEEAMAAREYVRQNPAATALVISDPYHMSRVRWSFEKTFQDTDIHLI